MLDLLLVVDTAAVDQRDPISDIQILRKELRLYDEDRERPWLIVANKIDLEESNLYLEALKPISMGISHLRRKRRRPRSAEKAFASLPASAPPESCSRQ